MSCRRAVTTARGPLRLPSFQSAPGEDVVVFRSTLKRGCVPAAVVVAMLAGCAGGQADKADPVGSTTATLNGYWKSTRPAGEIAVLVYFKYGTTTAYEKGRAFGDAPDGNCQVGWVPQSSACFALGPANTIHKYSVPVTGLTPNTTYHFSLCAADADQDKDICLNDATFKTGQPGSA
jgi:hypothetical protein